MHTVYKFVDDVTQPTSRMTPTKNVQYEFGEFTLLPHDRQLLHLNSPVEIEKRDLEILIYLVEHSPGIIKTNDFAAAIWTDRPQDRERNIAMHISKIRKILGCDPFRPKYIKTSRENGGYRLIVSVAVKEQGSVATEEGSSSFHGFQVASHVFVPMYLGREVYESIRGPLTGGPWISYRQLDLESSRLCIQENGFAVWHIESAGNFDHLLDTAKWRDEVYADLLGGKHPINACARMLLEKKGDDRLFSEIRGSPGYAFSAFVLESLPAKNPETVRNFLEILSTLSVLSLRDDRRSKAFELELLNRGLRNRDVEDFGFEHSDRGFASWDGISFRSGLKSNLVNRLVEIELAVQSLWWMCKCVAEKLLAGNPDHSDILRTYLPEIRRLYARIKSIDATESPSQRMMREAILRTSRLPQMVEEVTALAAN